MNCALWRQEISAMIDGALGRRREAEVKAHLSRCSGCRRFFEDHAELTRLLENSAPAYEPSEEVWNRIQESIASRKDRQRETSDRLEEILDWIRVPQLAYGLAAGLLLVLTGLAALHTQDSALMESRYMAALETYSIEVEGNPFISVNSTENPFFELGEAEPANPFRSGDFSK